MIVRYKQYRFKIAKRIASTTYSLWNPLAIDRLFCNNQSFVIIFRVSIPLFIFEISVHPFHYQQIYRTTNTLLCILLFPRECKTNADTFYNSHETVKQMRTQAIKFHSVPCRDNLSIALDYKTLLILICHLCVAAWSRRWLAKVIALRLRLHE